MSGRGGLTLWSGKSPLPFRNINPLTSGRNSKTKGKLLASVWHKREGESITKSHATLINIGWKSKGISGGVAFKYFLFQSGEYILNKTQILRLYCILEKP